MKNLIMIVILVFSLLLGAWWVRHRKLYEKYVSFWLAISFTFFVMTVFPGLVGTLSSRLGFEVPSNFVFSLASLTLLFISFQLSQDVTRLRRQVEDLTIETALNRGKDS
jgi:hypothetical protein